MLRSLNRLIGYSVHATDGAIGKVSEFYFDDAEWVIRYLVVDTGGWLSHRKVLLSPVSIERPDWANSSFPVSLTKKEIGMSPETDTDKPVARQHELDLHRHYGWEAYWAGEAIMGSPEEAAAAFADGNNENRGGKAFDPHLRTTGVVSGCRIHASDGEIGHVADFIADDTAWTIRYLVVDTRNILPGKSVLVSPGWTKKIDWENRKVYFDVTGEKVMNSPTFDPSSPVNRSDEETLYDYYGRPAYWIKQPTI